MKTKIFVIVLSLFSLNSFAQIKENVVKLNLQNFAFGSISLGYERALNEKNALNVNIGIPISKSLNESWGEDLMGEDYSVTEASVKNFHLRAAYRHYTGKKMVPQGFYLEPALKYQTLSPNLEGYNSDGEASVDGTLSTFTGGFQLGYQFLISKTVTLDLAFFGLEAGIANFDMDGTTSGDIDEYKQDIEDAISDLPVIGDKTTVTTNGNTVNVSTKSVFFPMFRAGFSVGIAF